MDPLDLAGGPARTVSLFDADLDSPGREAAMRNATSSVLTMPASIGRYTIGRRLGAGGMGEVFEAHDPTLGRPLAIKLVHGELADPSHAAAVRLLREAQTLARVNHPNVVQIYEVGIIDMRVYLAMEIVAGTTLREWSRQPNSIAARIDVLAQAGHGLHAVHRVGLVHRDVKPDNVIVGTAAPGSNVGRVRVVDFGLSRAGGVPTDPPHGEADVPISLASPTGVVPSRLTATGAMVGTPVYMAPEQILRRVIDARCDQFAFCVMAWEVLAGQRPFPSGNLLVLLEGHRRGPPSAPVGTEVPPAVWQALQRGLAHDPAVRWPDIETLVDALVRGSRRASPWGRRAAVAVLGASMLGIPWVVARADGDPCVGLGPDGPAARAQIQTVLALRDGAGADAPVDNLVGRMEALAEQRVAACIGSRTIDAADERRIDACLDRAAARLAMLSDALSTDGPTTAVVVTIDAEPTVDCANPSPWMPAPPADPVEADAVASVRRALDEAMTGLALGHVLQVAEHAPGLVALADATGHVPLIAEVAFFEGELASASGQPDRASDRLLAAADLAESSRHDVLAADAWAALVRVAIAELEQVDTARAYLRRAEASAARVGPDARRDRELRLRRGHLAALAGDVAAARAELAPLLATMGADGSDDAPHEWAMLRIAAHVEETAGNLDAAFALHERMRRAMVLHMDEASPSLAVVDYNLGKLDLRRDRAAPARAALERALDGWTRGSGGDHLDLALAHTALQQWETQYGSLAAAREHALRVLELRAGALPPDHPDVGLAHLGVGAAAMLLGDLDAARESYLTALTIHEQALGVDHPQTALVRLNLGEARVEAGDGAAALRDVMSAVAVLEAAGPLDPGLMAFAHRVHASALRASGADAAALVALDRAEALGVDVTDPPEAALRALERVRLARRQSVAVAWDAALDTARTRAAAVAGDGAMMIATRLDTLASDPPPRN